MNKFLILLLAVCLISYVHAFVKRDAPAGEQPKDTMTDLKESLEKLGKELSEKASEFLNPDVVKKNFNEFVDSVNKGIESVKAGTQKQ